jgi:lipopolysaccharide/colanic/teichoic acid biosynthesis glycosyltransferase
VGWLNGHRIGVILTDTPIEGAWKFADDISQSVAASDPPPACSVYTYPTQWLSGGDGRLHQSGRTSRRRQSDEDKVNGTSSGAEDETTGPGRAVEGLRSLFGHGLPFWKRALDVVGSLLGFVLLFPIFLGIAALIKIVSPGPVFFRQRRLGYLRKPFTLWKFRTMEADADPSLHRSHFAELIGSDRPMAKLDVDRDPRIIRFGGFLRSSCLDELPQLINVVKGEMSLIGPRPCLAYEAQHYLLWQNGRFDSVPGLTGLWQVGGKSRTTFNEMIRLDIRYGQHRSLWLDARILLKTVPAVVTYY